MDIMYYEKKMLCTNVIDVKLLVSTTTRSSQMHIKLKCSNTYTHDIWRLKLNLDIDGNSVTPVVVV